MTGAAPRGASNFYGLGGAAINARGGAVFIPRGRAAIGAAKKLQLMHAPLQILNRAKELRFDTNLRP